MALSSDSPEQEVRVRSCLINPQVFTPTTVVPDVQTNPWYGRSVHAAIPARAGSKLVRWPPAVGTGGHRNRAISNTLKPRRGDDAGHILGAGREPEITDRLRVHSQPVIVLHKVDANAWGNRRANKSGEGSIPIRQSQIGDQQDQHPDDGRHDDSPSPHCSRGVNPPN